MENPATGQIRTSGIKTTNQHNYHPQHFNHYLQPLQGRRTDPVTYIKDCSSFIDLVLSLQPKCLWNNIHSKLQSPGLISVSQLLIHILLGLRQLQSVVFREADASRQNALKIGFWAKTPPKIIFLHFWVLSARFICKNTTFLLNKLFSRMNLKFWLFLGKWAKSCSSKNACQERKINIKIFFQQIWVYFVITQLRLLGQYDIPQSSKKITG